MNNKNHTSIIKHLFIALITINCTCLLGQNNALILNGAYININNGTWASPIYLVVNNGQPAAILRNSGHIISEGEGNYVKWNTADVTATTNYIFPFGYSTTNYLPVTVHKNSIGAGAGHIDNISAINISTWGTPSGNLIWANSVSSMAGLVGADEFNSVIDRWWQIQSETNVNATVDVSYRGAENTTSASPTGTFNSQHWDASTSQWQLPNGTGTGVTAGIGLVNNITLTPHGLSNSSPYILSASISPLPIELVNFTANCVNNKIHINWKDASETNVNTIELQKSFNLNNWTTIYTALPSNSNNMSNYDFEYSEASQAAIYFRLITNNTDGESDISSIIYIQPCGSDNNTLTAFYFNSSLNVHTQFSLNSTVNYSLYNLQGKNITSGEFIAIEGDQLISIPLEQLSNAIYIFQAENNGQTYNQKVLISTK